MNDTTPATPPLPPRPSRSSSPARTFWGFVIAPAVGPILVLAVHIGMEEYSGRFLDNWRFDAMMGGLLSIIPSYLFGWLVGIPAHRYARRQEVNLSGWRGLLAYGACGAVLGIIAFSSVWTLFDFEPGILGQKDFLAAALMGFISGLSLWVMAVWRNPDFGYVKNGASSGDSRARKSILPRFIREAFGYCPNCHKYSLKTNGHTTTFRMRWYDVSRTTYVCDNCNWVTYRDHQDPGG